MFRNGVKYAGEIHFVHINRATGGLAVLGFFIQSDQMPSTNASMFSAGVGNLTASEWNNYIITTRNLQR